MPDAILVTGCEGPPAALPVGGHLMPGELASEAGREQGLAEPQLNCRSRGSRRLWVHGPEQ
eukprot:8701056-Alexandrium_andersonii.AAC.1